jgi:pimeloyl-ACP methyl ester carboxylesterase
MFRKIFSVAVLAMPFFLAGCQAPLKRAWDLPAGVTSLEANGYPIAFVERGTGPTVVLVHGAINDYRTWAPQMDALASRFRVVAISLRNYYPEPWKGDGEFSLSLHAKDVVAFIERLGAGPVALVGWSRGGTVAVDAARLRPDLVRKLVLMDPALFALLPPAPGEDPRIQRAKATHEYFKRGDMEGGLQFFVDGINGPGSWKALPEPQRALRRENAWTIVGQLGDVEAATCPDVSRLGMPLLLMEGEQSPPLFKRMRAAAQQCLPSAKFVAIPKAGHQMHQMNPAGFNAELIRFLSE